MTVVLVLGLEVIMNHIGLDEEYNLGSSVGSYDGITHGGKPVGSLLENLLSKRPDAEVGGIRRWSMNMRSRRKMCFNLT